MTELDALAAGATAVDPFAAPPGPVGPPVPGGAARPGRGMAVAGEAARVPAPPPAPNWPGSGGADETYEPDEGFDAADLVAVNRELNRCRARLFRISAQLKAAQRVARDADLAYRRQMRRALVQVSGGSAEARRALAEVMCEPLENALVVAEQVAEEWKKRAVDARDDLKAVENLSHNVRAQLALFERPIA